MPSGKDRSKEDTWKESDLKKALKDDRKKPRDTERKSKEHSSHRDEARKERRDREDDRRRRGHDEVVNGENDHKRSDRDKEREHRKRDEGRDRERTRDKERDRDREREREREKDREREQRRRKDGERSKERDRSRETRDKDKSRESRREKEGDDRERHHDREGRREKERDIEREADKRSKEKRGHDRDREGEHRRERGKERDRSRDRRKEREQEDKERGKDKAKERDNDRERERGKEKERDRIDKENKDSEREDRRRQRERHEKEFQESEKDPKRREHHRSRNEGSKDGRHEKREDRRERTRDDKDRRKERPEGVERKEKDAKSDKVRRREQELMDSLKKEEEFKKKEALKFRSDTLEEADQVDEDIGQRRKGSLHRVPSVAGAEEVNDEEATGYNYEEDFEEYEEDFEDDGDEGEDDDQETSVNLVDHAGMQELLLAINAENQDARLSSREGSKELIETTKESTKVTATAASASRGRINFVAARQKQITDNVASRTRRRGQELMHLIDLDVAAFDIFDLPPLNEYELYIKNFGRSDTKQAYVQCNEDNLEKEAQTEEIETRTKWTQNPATDAVGFGDEEDDSLDDLSTLTEKANIDSLRLSKFLQRAAQTCLILLEESVTERTSTQFKDRGDMSCSDGFIQLSTKHAYIEGRFVKCIHLSPVQSHLLLIAYGPVTDSTKVSSKTDTSVLEKGLVCLWNTNEPSEPSKVLICESVPRCCCLSPSKATLAFAGLEDGSLVAWDLRELSSLHYSSKITYGDSEVVLRLPTFSTAGILKKDESHLSPVVSILPVVMPGDRIMLQEISSASSARASGGTSLVSDDMLGLSFQLASLEENATISIWVVVELDRADTAGSESDLGLLPGGKIKLIKSSSISLQSPFRDFRKNLSLQALIMRFLPQDPNHIYVGTDGGYVSHCVRHGGRAPPKCYRPEIESVVEIAALDASPWQLPCILAGGKDGTLWLFNLKNETPLSTWSRATDGSAVVSLQWSRSKPSVFYVLDANSCLHVWDLLKSIQGPVAVENFKHGRVVSFDLSSDYSASGIGIPGRSPELVVAYESGAVEVHRLSNPFSKASGDELDRFASYLDGLL